MLETVRIRECSEEAQGWAGHALASLLIHLWLMSHSKTPGGPGQSANKDNSAGDQINRNNGEGRRAHGRSEKGEA